MRWPRRSSLIVVMVAAEVTGGVAVFSGMTTVDAAGNAAGSEVEANGIGASSTFLAPQAGGCSSNDPADDASQVRNESPDSDPGAWGSPALLGCSVTTEAGDRVPYFAAVAASGAEAVAAALVVFIVAAKVTGIGSGDNRRRGGLRRGFGSRGKRIRRQLNLRGSSSGGCSSNDPADDASQVRNELPDSDPGAWGSPHCSGAALPAPPTAELALHFLRIDRKLLARNHHPEAAGGGGGADGGSHAGDGVEYRSQTRRQSEIL
ncbi:hypothetical protein HDU96_001158 [Phlyctochytrium bullatum]|nr:hypothetical protein HDU96_001158 [Phlyctochytrium bullatum]